MSEQSVDGLALVRCLRPWKLVEESSNVAPVQNEVIDIPDDGNMEKVVVEKNVVGHEPVICNHQSIWMLDLRRVT